MDVEKLMGVHGFIARIVQDPDGLQKLGRDTQNQPLPWAQKCLCLARVLCFLSKDSTGSAMNGCTERALHSPSSCNYFDGIGYP